MGALHEGHLTLIRAAREACDHVVVSIFVNPTQFGPDEDFAKYPRPFDRDVAVSQHAGADVIFAPSPEDMYAHDTTRVRVSSVSDEWEGAARPGHFEGVATVVLKLFHISHANVAYFGLKDLQQCAVIESMVRDLFLPIELRFIETVRESDGLAMSSRNAYLSAEGRTAAATLNRVLFHTAQLIRTSDPSDAGKSIAQARRKLELANLNVEYFAMVDRRTMRAITVPTGHARLMATVRVEGVRLLDNVPVLSEA